MKKVDLGVGAGLLTLSVWLFWYAGRYKDLAVLGYGPDLFPRILASMMIVLALGLIMNALLGKSLKKEDSIDPKGFLRVLISIAICIGYLFLLKGLGFATSTFLFLFVLMTLLQQEKILLRIGASLIVSLTVWVIFRYFLVIPLPEGLLI